MNALCHDVHPKHMKQMRPGPVGSVGDVLCRPRFRQSKPTQPWAYDPYWTTERTNYNGSNVTDGDYTNYSSGGGPARTFDSKWLGNRSFKHQYGWSFHDVQSPDKSVEPFVSSIGDFSWRRKLAKTNMIKGMGQHFKVLPNGYEPSGIIRSGNFPRVTDVSGGDEFTDASIQGPSGVVTSQAGVSFPQPVIGRPNQPTKSFESISGVNTRQGYSRLGLQ